jgi:signal transduction histidine kinase
MRPPSTPSPGAQVVVELCLYVFLLRILAALVVVLDGSLPQQASTLGAVLLSCGLAVVATWTWRRTLPVVAAHPLLVAVDVAVSLLAVASAPDSAGVFVIALTTALLVGLVYDRVPAGLLGGCLVVGYLAVSRDLLGDRVASRATAMLLLVVAGRFVAERIERLSSQTTAATLALAQAQERARLAREMHDSVVKTMYGISMSAAVLADAPHVDPAVSSQLRGIADGAQAGAAEARALLSDLRADEPDRPLATVLRDYVETWAGEHGVAARFDANGVADLDGAARWELMMCVRETLDNVALHAGARHVAVSLDGDTRSVRVAVQDDGRGLDPERARADAVRRGRYGLQALHERMERVGGTTTVASPPGSGARVCFEVPQPTRRSRR